MAVYDEHGVPLEKDGEKTDVVHRNNVSDKSIQGWAEAIDAMPSGDDKDAHKYAFEVLTGKTVTEVVQ